MGVRIDTRSTTRDAGLPKRSFHTLRSLPADIFQGSHASFFDMKRKLAERAKGSDAVAPFIDREGYLRYIDRAEATLRDDLAKARPKAESAPSAPAVW